MGVTAPLNDSYYSERNHWQHEARGRGPTPARHSVLHIATALLPQAGLHPVRALPSSTRGSGAPAAGTCSSPHRARTRHAADFVDCGVRRVSRCGALQNQRGAMPLAGSGGPVPAAQGECSNHGHCEAPPRPHGGFAGCDLGRSHAHMSYCPNRLFRDRSGTCCDEHSAQCHVLGLLASKFPL